MMIDWHKSFIIKHLRIINSIKEVNCNSKITLKSVAAIMLWQGMGKDKIIGQSFGRLSPLVLINLVF